MEEEGVVMGGLLVGLNVIDANLCIKGEDLDSQVSPGGMDRPWRSGRAPSELFLRSHSGGSHRFLSLSERPSQQRASERVSEHVPATGKRVLGDSNVAVTFLQRLKDDGHIGSEALHRRAESPPQRHRH